MTLTNRARTYANAQQYAGETFSRIDVICAIQKAYKAGAKEQKKIDVTKAMNFVTDTKRRYTSFEDMFEQLKKHMEDEE